MRVISLFIAVAVLVGGCGDRSVENTGAHRESAETDPEIIDAAFPEEMAHYRQAFDAASLPTATATGKPGKTTAFDSKLLGVPYMPKDFEYPTDPDGNPLSLLAQINFADVPALRDFPPSGILQFYISNDMNGNKQMWGLQWYTRRPYDHEAQLALMQSQDYFRILWHEAVLTDEDELLQKMPSLPDGTLPVEDEAKLTFTASASYPNPTDYRFKEVFGEDLYEFFEQFGERADSVFERYMNYVAINEIAWIGGYAYFTQDDPRPALAEDDWLLLLEIQSSMDEDQPSVMWGDVGVGAFFIRREDLQRRDFSRVLYTWDSH